MAHVRRWAYGSIAVLTLAALLGRWTAVGLAARAAGPVTATFNVGGELDDVNESGTAFDGSLPTTWIGTTGLASASYSGLRFSLTIPQGATITSARLEVNSAHRQWISLDFELGIEDSSNAATVTNASPPSARVLTARRLTHSSNEPWQQDEWYSLGEVGPLLQDLVDRADWTSSSNVLFVTRGLGAPWGSKYVHSFDGRRSHAPRLVVVYETGGGTPPTPPPPPATPPPAAGFTNDTVVLGLDQPTSVTFTPDGRMLVTERSGQVRVVLPGRTSYEPMPFLKLTNVEATIGERALVNLALDPQFGSNGYYYVFYTRASPLRNVVSRFTASGNTTNLATEVVIFQDPTPAADIHHGGGLAFGTDGRLYISVGDGQDQSAGASHVSQRLTSVRGKVLRLNADGTVPADNPFHDGSGPNADAIWALGLRNPFRLSVDAQTGRVHVYDVGADVWEEINVLARGANFGWPICEGACTVGFANPFFSYSHHSRDAAIGGGVVYRGTAFPPSLRGNLFYGDYAQAWIRRLVLTGDGSVTQDLPFEPPDGNPDGSTGYVVDLDVGPDGALYYVDIGFGTVRRISYFSGNEPPAVASVTASPSSGAAPPLPVQFAVNATDPEGQPLTYQWEFGDGATSTERNPRHVYGAGGIFGARVLVSDGALTTYSNTLTISVGTGPTGAITSPVAGAIFSAGDVVGFAGQAEDGGAPLPASAYRWSVVFHHDTHTHPAFGPFTGITNGTFTVPRTGHDFSGNTWYEVVLSVTDAQGLTATARRSIFPRKVDLTLASNPPGLQLGFDAMTHAAPFVRDSLVSFSHRLTAPSPQVVGGTTYQFESWSDGGAAVHDIATPAVAATLTATFRPTTAVGPITLRIPLAGGVDDVNEDGGAYHDSEETAWLGTGETATTSYAGLRFTGVAVPRGARVLSAWLEVNSVESQWISLAYEIGVDAAGNSAPLTPTSRPSSRQLATPRVSHSSDVQWAAGGWYSLEDVGALVQAVISRPDWAPQNSLTLVIRGIGSTWGRKLVHSRDAGLATAPRLVVVYGPPGS